jgi:hypothetical protein
VEKRARFARSTPIVVGAKSVKVAPARLASRKKANVRIRANAVRARVPKRSASKSVDRIHSVRPGLEATPQQEALV